MVNRTGNTSQEKIDRAMRAALAASRPSYSAPSVPAPSAPARKGILGSKAAKPSAKRADPQPAQAARAPDPVRVATQTALDISRGVHQGNYGIGGDSLSQSSGDSDSAHPYDQVLSAKVLANMNARQRAEYDRRHHVPSIIDIIQPPRQPDAPTPENPPVGTNTSNPVLTPIIDGVPTTPVIPDSTGPGPTLGGPTPPDTTPTKPPTQPVAKRLAKLSGLRIEATADRYTNGTSQASSAQQPRQNPNTCKPRPADNKPAGAGGSFKNFVPWCR